MQEEEEADAASARRAAYSFTAASTEVSSGAGRRRARVPQQTQHVALQEDDLDHVGQLTRSKHDSTKERDYHLATAMDP